MLENYLTCEFNLESFYRWRFRNTTSESTRHNNRLKAYK